MNDFIFILIISFFILLLIYIAYRILTKKIIGEKTILPQDIDFNSSLNNLDKIVDGVSKKEKEETLEAQPEKEETKPEHEKLEIEQKKEKSKSRVLQSKLITKNTFIGKEIIDRKKDED